MEVNYSILVEWSLRILLLSGFTATKDVVLLDTTKTKRKTLGWVTHSSSSEDGDGWQEESYVRDQDRINWRTYVTCDVMISSVQNWVRTPYIIRGSANRLYVESTFTMRDCKYFKGSAKTCKETFSLFYFESDMDFASPHMPAWSDRTFTRVDRIAGDKGRFSSRQHSASGDVTNVETRSVPVSKKGIYFAYMDEGSCTSLLAVKIYYKACDPGQAGFASFPETPTGPERYSIIKVTGTCVSNASPGRADGEAQFAQFLCKPDGSWQHLSFPCQCNPGYYGLDDQRCLPCPVDMYKSTGGPHVCKPCPLHSTAIHDGAASCDCQRGYYRVIGTNNAGIPCTKPPSRPLHPRQIRADSSSVTISWIAPSDFGSEDAIWYSIKCIGCPKTTDYTPAKAGFNETTVTISGLHSSSSYTVHIFAENAVSDQDPSKSSVVFEAETTKILSYDIRDLRAAFKSRQKLVVEWSPPLDPNVSSSSTTVARTIGLDHQEVETAVVALVDRYAVKRFMKRGGDGPNLNITEYKTTRPLLVLYDLIPGVEYGFQVQAFISATQKWGEWSDIVWIRAKPDQKVNPLKLKALWIVGLLLIIPVVLLCTLLCCRRSRRRRRTPRKEPEPIKAPNRNLIDGCKSVASPLLNKSLPFAGAMRPYVDPTTYEDPHQAIQEFASEISADFVVIEEIIGAGEFGEVCKGRLRCPNLPDQTVAIKTLKPGSSEQEKANFLTEASIMGQFCHPNVIALCGVVTKSEPAMIITQYMPNRSLDSFLRANDGNMSICELIQMLRGVASGMKYLAEIGFVHRDLAARNILVDSSLACKIADFGLSRITEGSVEQVYTTKGGKIPVRWTAPEAIAYRKYSSASDVWSFGVVIWEVISWAERPYWDWTNQQVIQAIDRGYRLPPPLNCPKVVYDLMLQCWLHDRTHRPTFGSLLRTLDEFIIAPEVLLVPAQGASYEYSRTLPLPPASCCARPGRHSAATEAGGDFNTSQHSSHIQPSSSAYRIMEGGSDATDPLRPPRPPHTESPLRSAPSWASNLPTVEQWLRSLNMDDDDIVEAFHSAGLIRLGSCFALNSNDFTALGVTDPTQQRILLASLERLRLQQSFAGSSSNQSLPRHRPSCASSNKRKEIVASSRDSNDSGISSAPSVPPKGPSVSPVSVRSNEPPVTLQNQSTNTGANGFAV